MTRGASDYSVRCVVLEGLVKGGKIAKEKGGKNVKSER